MQANIEQAAEYIQQADGILITAGAGMGIDSGLPDFRGASGFWRAFPPLAKLQLNFEEMATPDLFERDPRLAWGFYGLRLNSYRNTVPHQGFHLLQKWAKTKPNGAFVCTSNVDGQFQTAGFAPECVFEKYGTIHRLQCTNCHGVIVIVLHFPRTKKEQLFTTKRAKFAKLPYWHNLYFFPVQ